MPNPYQRHMRFLFIFIAGYAVMVWLLFLGLSLVGCRMPDAAGVQAGYGETAGHASPRPWLPNGDAEHWWVAPYAQWNIGQQARHDEIIKASIEERAAIDRMRDEFERSVRDSQAHDDHGPIGPQMPPPAGDEDPGLTKMLVGAIVAGFLALAGAVKYLTGRKPKETE